MTDKTSETPRLKLRNMTSEQIAPMERLFKIYTPLMWREFALSFFATLLSLKDWREMEEAQLALKMAEGVGEDFGGSQPYIPTGEDSIKTHQRREMVLEMLAQGASYADAAAAASVTESRARKIQQEERNRKKRAAVNPTAQR